MARRALLPPLFRAEEASASSPVVRRAAASLLLFVVLWITVFAPLGALGTSQEVDFSAVPTPQLFLVHAILLTALAAWFALGFVGTRDGMLRIAGTPGRQFGLRVRSLLGELGLGVLCGIAVWMAVLTFLIGIGVVVWSLGGDEALPREPPAMVPWIASLPLATRLAISASAGFTEELFFRGFLQPRVGIALSTALFALAHLSYDQPLMLVGVTLLSLTFALLVRWRQSIWAAVVAHAVFDAIQLTFVIPWALRFMESGGADFVATVCYTALHWR